MRVPSMFDRIKLNHAGAQAYAGAFSTANTAAPTDVDAGGCVVKRTGVGTFTVTLPRPLKRTFLVLANLQTVSNGSRNVKWTGSDDATGVYTFVAQSADGTAADFVAASRICFLIVGTH